MLMGYAHANEVGGADLVLQPLAANVSRTQPFISVTGPPYMTTTRRLLVTLAVLKTILYVVHQPPVLAEPPDSPVARLRREGIRSMCSGDPAKLAAAGWGRVEWTLSPTDARCKARIVDAEDGHNLRISLYAGGSLAPLAAIVGLKPVVLRLEVYPSTAEPVILGSVQVRSTSNSGG